MVLRWVVQVLHSPQKFKRPPFWNGCSNSIRYYGVEVTFRGMTSLLNFIKNLPIGSEVEGGEQADTQDDDLISLHFSFRNEGRITINKLQQNSLCLLQAPYVATSKGHLQGHLIYLQCKPLSFTTLSSAWFIIIHYLHDVHKLNAYSGDCICLSVRPSEDCWLESDEL
jgi:hypothetical protein